MIDVAIIGAGIAGASLAYFLKDDARVTLYEAESHPGYHTTGRSAAFFSETYGGPAIQPLSTASLPFFDSPPEGFASAPLLTPRGCLHIAQDPAELSELAAEFAGTGVAIEPAAVPAYVQPGWRHAMWEPGCRDIDVAALHQGFLAGARRNGATLACDSPIQSLRYRNNLWELNTPLATHFAHFVVIAAGAWSDRIAALAGAAPLGLQPMQRTVSVVRTTPAADPALPLVIDAAGSFYFKPDGGKLWLSPHDETPAEPGDAQAEELAIATAIDRFESATTFKVERVERSWAGLRTFAPDRLPVYGFDAQVPDLFWCAGQGGFGIQTAPAAGQLAAALLLGRDPGLPGVDPTRYAATRFAKAPR